MKESIELLIKLGLSPKQGYDFVKNIANEAYSDGYREGTKGKPSIIGESSGESGLKEQLYEVHRDHIPSAHVYRETRYKAMRELCIDCELLTFIKKII